MRFYERLWHPAHPVLTTLAATPVFFIIKLFLDWVRGKEFDPLMAVFMFVATGLGVFTFAMIYYGFWWWRTTRAR